MEPLKKSHDGEQQEPYGLLVRVACDGRLLVLPAQGGDFLAPLGFAEPGVVPAGEASQVRSRAALTSLYTEVFMRVTCLGDGFFDIDQYCSGSVDFFVVDMPERKWQERTSARLWRLNW